jgi:hypothetical protein
VPIKDVSSTDALTIVRFVVCSGYGFNLPHIFLFSCFVPQIAPNPCNHYYLRGNGEDSYVDFRARNGYLPAIDNVVSAGDIEFEGTTNKKKMD